jgi:hypothetical protein
VDVFEISVAKTQGATFNAQDAPFEEHGEGTGNAPVLPKGPEVLTSKTALPGSPKSIVAQVRATFADLQARGRDVTNAIEAASGELAQPAR